MSAIPPPIPVPPHRPSSADGGLWKARHVALVMILVSWLAAGWQLYMQRKEALSQTTTLVAGMANAIEQHLVGSFRAIDGLLQKVATAAEEGRWHDPAFRQRLSVELNGFPEIRFIGITDADGRLGGDTEPAMGLSPDGLDVSERTYFRRQKEGAAAPAMIVGDPVQGLAVGQRSIHLSRPLRDASGRFIGVVVANVNPDGYARFLQTLLLEDAGGSAVIRTDGTILARAPLHAEKFGTNVITSDLFTVFLAKSPVGVGHFVSKANGVEKLLGYRRMEHYPLVVTSGLSIATSLRQWHWLVRVELLLLALFSGCLYYWARQADLREQRLREHRERLEEEVGERTAALQHAKHIAEERLQRLAAVNHELRRLAQVTSHHLQEPVRPIVSYAQMTRRRLEGRDQEVETWLTFMEQAGLRLKALLRDFQRYASVLAEAPKPAKLDMNRIAENALSHLHTAIADSRAAITVAPLPSVWADDSMMENVFRQLLDNAIRHRHPDRPPVVDVKCVEHDGAFWRFEVSDNGKGIAPAQDARAFEAFEQLNSSSTGNTGLGLAICRAIVQAHGGHIWIEHLPVGSRFCFTLPKAGEAS